MAPRRKSAHLADFAVPKLLLHWLLFQVRRTKEVDVGAAPAATAHELILEVIAPAGATGQDLGKKTTQTLHQA